MDVTVNFYSENQNAQGTLINFLNQIKNSNTPDKFMDSLDEFMDFIALKQPHFKLNESEKIKSIRVIDFKLDTKEIVIQKIPSFDFNFTFYGCRFHNGLKVIGNRPGHGNVGRLTLISTNVSELIISNLFGDVLIHDECELKNFDISGKRDQLNVVHITKSIIDNFNAGGVKLRSISLEKSVFKEYFSIFNAEITMFKCENCEFNGYMRLDDKESISYVVQNPIFSNFESSAEESYRNLKMFAKQRGDDRLADIAVQHEVKTHNHNINKETEPGVWVLGKAYWLLNDFGLSLFRPLYWIITTSVFSFFVFYVLSLSCLDKVKCESQIGWGMFEMATYLAFKVMLGPLGFISDFKLVTVKSVSVVIFITMASVINSVLWFFFIIGIRKRFKVKE